MKSLRASRPIRRSMIICQVHVAPSCWISCTCEGNVAQRWLPPDIPFKFFVFYAEPAVCRFLSVCWDYFAQLSSQSPCVHMTCEHGPTVSMSHFPAVHAVRSQVARSGCCGMACVTRLGFAGCVVTIVLFALQTVEELEGEVSRAWGLVLLSARKIMYVLTAIATRTLQ